MHRLPVLGQIDASASLSPSRVRTPASRAEVNDKLARIGRKVGEAMGDFAMLAEGDRVMVCVSGGKDSYALLDLLLRAQKRAPINFTLVAVNVDQGWPGYATNVIEDHVRSRGVEYRMVKAHEIAATVERVLRPEETGATPCSLCSRLRRGVLYSLADEMGATKIALGHHLDDLIETLLMNLFFAGALRSMPPRLVSDDGRHIVIRPLAYVEESDLQQLSALADYPTVRCSCPTCGLPDQQRQVIKRLVSSLAESHPGLRTHMRAAMGNVKAEHLLDHSLLQKLIAVSLPVPGAQA